MKITLLFPANGAIIDSVPESILNYLRITEPDDVAKYFLSGSMTAPNRQVSELSWQSDGSEYYDVLVSGLEPIRVPANESPDAICRCYPQLLVPGSTYAWYVLSANGGESEIRTFTVRSGAPRIIAAEDIMNLRDIGGYAASDGSVVRHGLIYRSARLNGPDSSKITENGRHVLHDILGIKSELDLRQEGWDDGGQRESVIEQDVAYFKHTFTTTSYILPQFSQTEPRPRTHDLRVLKAFPAIFEILADESNYPLLLHCGAGADRTGTICFLINGLLGVSYDDLVHDFELTTFFGTGNRLRSGLDGANFAKSGTFYGVFQDDEGNYVGFDKMVRMLMEFYYTEDHSLSSAIENYLVNYCKVKKEHIDKLRKIMLG